MASLMAGESLACRAQDLHPLRLRFMRHARCLRGREVCVRAFGLVMS